ncbi:MAG: DUF2917 domain-containing protein [Limnohabitans sp.]
MDALFESAFVIDGLWSARPQTTHTLQVLEGRAWATVVGELDADNPDHVLVKGNRLQVLRGQHLVVEVWPRHDNDILKVAWQVLNQADIDVTNVNADSASA